jgi:hypothetical protein
MSQLDDRRFFPVPPEVVYGALLAAIRDVGFGLKSKDDFSKAVRVSTPMSGWSWGAVLSLSVMPESGGASIRVSGGAKLKTNITAHGSEAKKIAKLLDAVSTRVRPYADENADKHAVVGEATNEGVESLTGELLKLATMRDSGSLSDEEFAAAKAKLLR